MKKLIIDISAVIVVIFILLNTVIANDNNVKESLYYVDALKQDLKNNVHNRRIDFYGVEYLDREETYVENLKRKIKSNSIVGDKQTEEVYSTVEWLEKTVLNVNLTSSYKLFNFFICINYEFL